MILNSLSNREIAIIYAHYMFRDATVVENLHGKAAEMNDEVYNEIYKAVKNNLSRIKRYHKKLCLIDNETELRETMDKMYPTRGVEFGKYVICMNSYVKYKCGRNWDEALIMEGDIPKDLTQYVLSGCFKICCEEHMRLDDEIMCLLNKDIHNRVYTLIQKNYLW